MNIYYSLGSPLIKKTGLSLRMIRFLEIILKLLKFGWGN